MRLRTFFLLSLSLAIVAVGLHLTAMSQTSSGLRIRAQATAPESYRATARAVARNYAKRGAVLGYIGFAFAVASVTFLVVSARKHEPARRIVVFGVLIFYLMLQSTFALFLSPGREFGGAPPLPEVGATASHV